ncbi:MAG: hypothetical protein JNN08_29520 [Bryobacterales bacterium]|nr:hypothetical protein [Bryobacterales bacterium]
MAASITSTIPARIVAVFLGFSLMLFGVSVKSFVASPATLSFSSANPDGTPTVQATLTYEIDAVPAEMFGL